MRPESDSELRIQRKDARRLAKRKRKCVGEYNSRTMESETALSMNAFFNDSAVRGLMEQVLERYSDIRDPEATGLLEKFEAAAASNAALERKMAVQVVQLSEKETEMTRLRGVGEGARATAIELRFAKEDNTRFQNMNTRLHADVEHLRKERFLFEKQLRAQVASEIHDAHVAECAVQKSQNETLKTRIQDLETEVNAMTLVNQNASIKGATYEMATSNEIAMRLGIEIRNMSTIPNSMDLCCVLFKAFNIYIDTKNYQGPLPVKEVIKYEKDRTLLMSQDEHAHGFVLLCIKGVTNVHRYELVADGLYKHKNNSFLVTQNNFGALYKAFMLIMQNSGKETLSALAGEAEQLECEPCTCLSDFNRIMTRTVPLFQLVKQFVAKVKASVKEWESGHQSEAAALLETINSSDLDLQTTKLMTALQTRGQKRKKVQ